MEERLWEALEVLADYDGTIHHFVSVLDLMHVDTKCSPDTLGLGEALLVSLLCDKSEHLVPQTEEGQDHFLAQAEGINEVWDSLPKDSLLYQVVIGHAILLAQTHNGWRPWERVREALIGQEEGEETVDET